MTAKHGFEIQNINLLYVVGGIKKKDNLCRVNWLVDWDIKLYKTRGGRGQLFPRQCYLTANSKPVRVQRRRCRSKGDTWGAEFTSPSVLNTTVAGGLVVSSEVSVSGGVVTVMICVTSGSLLASSPRAW